MGAELARVDFRKRWAKAGLIAAAIVFAIVIASRWWSVSYTRTTTAEQRIEFWQGTFSWSRFDDPRFLLTPKPSEFQVVRWNPDLISPHLRRFVWYPSLQNSPTWTQVEFPVWWLGVFFVGLAVWSATRRPPDPLICGQCGYTIAGLTGATCPECGEPLNNVPAGESNSLPHT